MNTNEELYLFIEESLTPEELVELCRFSYEPATITEVQSEHRNKKRRPASVFARYPLRSRIAVIREFLNAAATKGTKRSRRTHPRLGMDDALLVSA